MTPQHEWHRCLATEAGKQGRKNCPNNNRMDPDTCYHDLKNLVYDTDEIPIPKNAELISCCLL